MQLALPVSLEDSAAFENYLPGANAVALTTLSAVVESAATGHLVYLWGELGVGKTHLLIAACRRAEQLGLRTRFYPGRNDKPDTDTAPRPSLVPDDDGVDLIAIDDIGQLAGDDVSERVLMQIYEQRHRRNTRLIVAGSLPPPQLGLRLADVATRLSAEYVFRLQGLSDTGKAQAMTLRAERRGLQLDNDVIQYILARLPRDNVTMFRLLDAIDERSLQKQRRITIPLVKELLTGQAPPG
jgi:DnaA family protein